MKPDTEEAFQYDDDVMYMLHLSLVVRKKYIYIEIGSNCSVCNYSDAIKASTKLKPLLLYKAIYIFNTYRIGCLIGFVVYSQTSLCIKRPLKKKTHKYKTIGKVKPFNKALLNEPVVIFKMDESAYFSTCRACVSTSFNLGALSTSDNTADTSPEPPLFKALQLLQFLPTTLQCSFLCFLHTNWSLGIQPDF